LPLEVPEATKDMKDTKEIKEKGVGGGGISRTRIGGRVLVGSQVSARTRISCYAINERSSNCQLLIVTSGSTAQTDKRSHS